MSHEWRVQSDQSTSRSKLQGRTGEGKGPYEQACANMLCEVCSKGT